MGLPPRRVVVLLNGAAGSVAGSDLAKVRARVAAAFSTHGVSALVEDCPADAVLPAARQAAAGDTDAVVAAGGDGTVSTAAAALAGGEVPLGIVPLGTLNHFARDLGLPQDLEGAAGTVAAGRVRAVDVGEVNGRVFLNNSSIGLYPELVEGREELRQRAGLGRWTAMLYAATAVLRRFPLLALTLQADGRSATLRTPFVFVANNAYELRLLALGRRRALDAGELSVYISSHQSRLGLLGLALRTALGLLHQDRDFRTLSLRALAIHTPRRTLRVAADGEVRRTPVPIRYCVRPGALRVLAPPP